MIPHEALEKCTVVMAICFGMGATNSFSRAPPYSSRQTTLHYGQLCLSLKLNISFPCLGRISGNRSV